MSAIDSRATITVNEPCIFCDGSGERYNKTCNQCHGMGTLQGNYTLEQFAVAIFPLLDRAAAINNARHDSDDEVPAWVGGDGHD